MRSCVELLSAVGVLTAAQGAFAQSGLPEAPSLPIVTVQATFESPATGVGQTTVVDLSRQPAFTSHLDQLLVDEGIAAWDAGNSLGISNGLSMRGFVVTNNDSSALQVGRHFLNGHADLVWRFSRDPATVARVEVIGGSDATLLGSGSPAGALLYTSRTPNGTPFQSFGLALGTSGLVRLTGDVERHAGPLQTRLAFAMQRGDKGVEGVTDARNVLLLANRLPIGQGVLRFDVEYHQNTKPYTFGTAYAGGAFLV